MNNLPSQGFPFLTFTLLSFLSPSSSSYIETEIHFSCSFYVPSLWLHSIFFSLPLPHVLRFFSNPSHPEFLFFYSWILDKDSQKNVILFSRKMFHISLYLEFTVFICYLDSKRITFMGLIFIAYLLNSKTSQFQKTPFIFISNI